MRSVIGPTARKLVTQRVAYLVHYLADQANDEIVILAVNFRHKSANTLSADTKRRRLRKAENPL
jgi:hypothetical protein